ncbi:hypothetical protein T310_7685, partial [Rasamsonia emersonii CBS 393.64]
CSSTRIVASHLISLCTRIVFRGTSSPEPDSSSRLATSIRMPRALSAGRKAESLRRRKGGKPLSWFLPPRLAWASLLCAPGVMREALLLPNRREISTKRGRRVGRQAEMMPLAHSMTHHVQAVDRVPKIVRKRREKRPNA